MNSRFPLARSSPSAAEHVPYPDPGRANPIQLLVAALFGDRPTAERACRVVTGRGYSASEIHLLMTTAACSRHFPPDARAGVVATVVVAFARSVVLPGLSLLIAGPLATSLANDRRAQRTHDLAGTLFDWDIPRMRVKAYEAALKQGKILLAVRPHSVADANHFEHAWKKDDDDLWGRAAG